MVSEFPPAGIIGLGLSVSTILLEIVLGDRPDDFVDVLPGLKLKWPQKHAIQGVGIHVIVQKTPRCSSRFEIFSMRLILACRTLTSFSSVRILLKGSDLRQVSSHPIKALSSLASNPFKEWSGLILLHDGPLHAA